MARDSEKKALKAAAAAEQKYLVPIAAVNALYLLVRVLPALGAFDWGEAQALLWYSGITYATYRWIIKAIKGRHTAEYAQDVFIVNLAAQALSCFVSWGWYLYLLIVAYVVYLGAPFVWGKLTGGKGDQEPELTEAEKAAEEKRKAKKERKAARVAKFR